jgi:sulfotransferase family protein
MFDYNSMHASIATLRQKQIFFVGGSPKSGTTWLQLLLDAHPSVSCSGEGRFPSLLWSDLKQALDHYDRAIETDNKELFNELEEYQRLTQDDIYYIFASCIAVLLLKQSKHKLARAIGDKTPANVRAFAGLAALFPRAKFIQIVRDGRDCAVSGWFHNLRNPDWTPLNRGSLTAYVSAFSELWVSDLAMAQEFADAHPDRIRRIRYEDLARDTEGILAGLFEFLGVEVDPSVLAHCRTEASFAKRTGGRNPGEENRQSFFRKGMAGDWRNHLSDEQNALFRERAGTWLDRFGYA